MTRRQMNFQHGMCKSNRDTRLIFFRHLSFPGRLTINWSVINVSQDVVPSFLRSSMFPMMTYYQSFGHKCSQGRHAINSLFTYVRRLIFNCSVINVSRDVTLSILFSSMFPGMSYYQFFCHMIFTGSQQSGYRSLMFTVIIDFKSYNTMLLYLSSARLFGWNIFCFKETFYHKLYQR